MTQLSYWARVSAEGADYKLLVFPDCPGCGTFVWTRAAHTEVVRTACEVLAVWLESCLVHTGGVPASVWRGGYGVKCTVSVNDQNNEVIPCL